MSKMMVHTMEFDKDGDDLSEQDELLEITEATADGSVEIALDITPKAQRLYVRIPLHELVRLAMIEGREKAE